MTAGGAIDPERFARLLCGWCLDVGERDQVLIRSTTLAAPLLRAVSDEVLRRGAWPLLRVELPGQAEAFHVAAQADHLLDELPPLARVEVESVDCFLAIQAPDNTRALAGVDPGRIARMGRAAAPLTEIRMRKRWCGTLWPVPARAQDAGMSLADYSAFVRGALLLDREEPEAAWRELSVRQAAVIEQVAAADEIRIEAEGTDLRLRVSGRTWVNSDGKRNMPSGEVFTGPHEDSAEGTIRFGIPSSPAGVEVAEVELTFRAGEVVAARAERGDAYLQQMLATDPGARRLGELGIGTNSGITRPTGTILLDEKIGGTVHLALGRSYAETGGVNQSALHWDLICDLREGGRLTADGEEVHT